MIHSFKCTSPIRQARNKIRNRSFNTSLIEFFKNWNKIFPPTESFFRAPNTSSILILKINLYPNNASTKSFIGSKFFKCFDISSLWDSTMRSAIFEFKMSLILFSVSFVVPPRSFPPTPVISSNSKTR